MNDYYREIVIDGQLHSGEFKGTALVIDDSMLKLLMYLKETHPQSLDKILKLLFDRINGAAFTKVVMNADSKAANSFTEYMRSFGHQFSVIQEKSDIAFNSNSSVTEIGSEMLKNSPSFTFYRVEDIICITNTFSGEFVVRKAFFPAAHVNRFACEGAVCTGIDTQSEYTAFYTPDGNYSVCFVNREEKSKKYSLCIRALANADKTVYCIVTKTGGSKNTLLKKSHKMIPVMKSYGCCFNAEVEGDSILTLTTMDISSMQEEFSYEKPPHKTDAYRCVPDNSRKYLPLYELSGQFITVSPDEKKSVQFLTPCLSPENDQNNNDFTYAVLGDVSMTRYTVSTFIEFDNKGSSNNFAGVGIYCNAHDRKGYHVRLYPDGRSELIDNTGKCIALGSYVPQKGGNSVSVAVKNMNLLCEINGKTVFEKDITALPALVSGMASLISANCENRFSNTQITPLTHSSPLVCDLKFNTHYGNGERLIKLGETKDGRITEIKFYGEAVALIGKTQGLVYDIQLDDENERDNTCPDCGNDEAFLVKTGLKQAVHTLKFAVLKGSAEISNVMIYHGEDTPLVKKARLKMIKKEQSKDSVKIGTLIMGTGLAALGLGAVLINKKFRRRKKNEQR